MPQSRILKALPRPNYLGIMPGDDGAKPEINRFDNEECFGEDATGPLQHLSQVFALISQARCASVYLTLCS